MFANKIIDISALSELKNLTSLVMSKNPISDISALSGLKKLTVLIIGNTQISDINPLKDMIHLNYLNINRTQVNDLSPLNGLTNLTTLFICFNQNMDLTPLNKVNLNLHIQMNGTNDLSMLSGLVNIERININCDNFRFAGTMNDLSTLSSLDNLKVLNLDYNKLFEKLREKGIEIAEGLTEAEIHKIEEIYDIRFPESLRKFYSIGVPFSEDENGFPQWSNFSDANIAKIKERIQAPIDWLLLPVKKEDYWLPNWGKRPESDDEIIKHFTELTKKAPRLIPLYGHRYMPQLDGADDPPVISTVGRDIVYYGGSLQEYLRNEFLNDGYITRNKNFKYIPFWSDIISANNESFNNING